MVKNPSAVQETWVQSPGGEDTLEKAMASHSRILAWRIPWTEEPGGLQSMGAAESWTQLSESTATTVDRVVVIVLAKEKERAMVNARTCSQQ